MLLQQDIPWMILTEYFDESLILLRRYLCWNTKDIIYSRLKASPGKKSRYISPDVVSDTIVEKHRHYNPGDYALYAFYNNTLWDILSKQTEDFWEEVKVFRNINNQVADFCKDIYAVLKVKNMDIASLRTLLLDYYGNELVIAQNKWTEEFTVDPLDCALMMLSESAYRNIFTVKQHPRVCSYVKTHTMQHYDVNNYVIANGGFSLQVKMNAAYCDKKETRYNIPLRVLTFTKAYDWDFLVPQQGNWEERIFQFNKG